MQSQTEQQRRRSNEYTAAIVAFVVVAVGGAFLVGRALMQKQANSGSATVTVGGSASPSVTGVASWFTLRNAMYLLLGLTAFVLFVGFVTWLFRREKPVTRDVAVQTYAELYQEKQERQQLLQEYKEATIEVEKAKKAKNAEAEIAATQKAMAAETRYRETSWQSAWKAIRLARYVKQQEKLNRQTAGEVADMMVNQIMKEVLDDLHTTATAEGLISEPETKAKSSGIFSRKKESAVPLPDLVENEVGAVLGLPDDAKQHEVNQLITEREWDETVKGLSNLADKAVDTDEIKNKRSKQRYNKTVRGILMNDVKDMMEDLTKRKIVYNEMKQLAALLFDLPNGWREWYYLITLIAKSDLANDPKKMGKNVDASIEALVLEIQKIVPVKAKKMSETELAQARELMTKIFVGDGEGYTAKKWALKGKSGNQFSSSKDWALYKRLGGSAAEITRTFWAAFNKAYPNASPSMKQMARELVTIVISGGESSRHLTEDDGRVNEFAKAVLTAANKKQPAITAELKKWAAEVKQANAGKKKKPKQRAPRE